ncbi:MAG: hypothetical protein NUV55_07135 [Sulfuricaulis sp.]|uniref:hypothetical protein n=1 Tax=Sulfuricaulis sp. TaxID=2003553 RepID=UPI0025F7580A|nr:hypothetical protein [Sulfuricaulis sp.]MCR4346960.1 hypothetical protein [Sulfuricaulis sp.]
MSAVRYYSMRRFSPYQGTVQITELPDFRAVTSDGIAWRVQFLNQRSRLSSHAVWRADGGGNLIETARTSELIQALQEHPPFPFPPQDKLELWLLDAREQKPLAILASTLGRIKPPRSVDTRWHATLAEDDSFVAPSLASGTAAISSSHIPHSQVLSRCVQKAAGPLERAQWFRREDDGSGIGLHGNRLDDGHVGRKLGCDVFPELLLRETWEVEQEQSLVSNYHDWQAPCLLTHSKLLRSTRDRLERAACRQAEKLYKVRHFLPEIINQDLLNVAFVEAVIRRST